MRSLLDGWVGIDDLTTPNHTRRMNDIKDCQNTNSNPYRDREILV
jgi:hypothetical protein